MKYINDNKRGEKKKKKRNNKRECVSEGGGLHKRRVAKKSINGCHLLKNLLTFPLLEYLIFSTFKKDIASLIRPIFGAYPRPPILPVGHSLGQTQRVRDSPYNGPKHPFIFK